MNVFCVRLILTCGITELLLISHTLLNYSQLRSGINLKLLYKLRAIIRSRLGGYITLGYQEIGNSIYRLQLSIILKSVFKKQGMMCIMNLYVWGQGKSVILFEHGNKKISIKFLDFYKILSNCQLLAKTLLHAFC